MVHGVPLTNEKVIDIYWECDEAGVPVHLIKTDSSRPNVVGYAVIENKVIDRFFRDTEKNLIGIVPDKYLKELKRFYKRRKVNA